MPGRQKIGDKFSIVLTPDLAALVEEVRAATGEETSPLLRKALRAGLPLVKSGGAADVLTLDSELSQFVNELAKLYKRTRNSILLDSIRRGVRAVEAHLLHSSASDIPPEVSKMMLDTNPDAEPLLREVRNAKIAKGALQIQLDDLLQHSAEARERKEVVEKVTALHRQRSGTHPNMCGSGVSTAELKRQIAELTKELEQGAGPSPETVSMLKQFKALSESGPRYFPKRIMRLPVTVTPTASASSPVKPSKRAKKKPGQ